MNAGSPSPDRAARLRQLFSPSPKVRNFLLGTGILVTILACCIGGFSLIPTSQTPDALSDIQLFLFAFSVLIIPLAVVLLIIVAFFEKRDPPRAVLWLIATLLILLAGVLLTGIMASDSEMGPDVLAFFLLLGVGPVFLLISLPGVYFTARTIPQIRAVIINDRTERALAFIQARGHLTFNELSIEVGMPLSEVDNLVDDFLRSGKLAGTMDVSRQIIYTAAALADRQRLLLETIRVQGRVRLEDIARILQTPQEVLRDWIYQIVQRGQFNGYVNWDQGWLYSSLAKEIGAESQCPNCGGKLVPSGSSIHCLSCGSEILSEPHLGRGNVNGFVARKQEPQ